MFGLVVRGDSMIEDGIFDGDYIFVRAQLNASNGDLIVALLDGETTCKRFFAEGEHVRLQPSNESMAPIYMHRSELRQLGKVVGVYRRVG